MGETGILRRLLNLGGFIALIGIIYATSSRVLEQGFDRVEKAELTDNVRRMQNAFDDQIGKLNAVAGSWSEWTEACEFINSPHPQDSAFISSELNDGALANLNSNAIIYARTNGTFVFATGFDSRALHHQALPPGLQTLLRRSALLQYPDAKSRWDGLLTLPAGVMMFASRPVIRSGTKGPVEGAMFIGRFFDADLEKQISTRVELPIEIKRLDDAALPPDFAQARSDLFDASGSARSNIAFATRALSEDNIAGYLPIQDFQGRPVLLARVSMPRATYTQGRSSLFYLLVSISGIGLVLGAIVMLAQEQLLHSQRQHLEEDARFRAVFDGMGEGLLITDLQDRVRLANQRMEELCGYSVEEMVGRPAYEFLLPREHWPVLHDRNDHRAKGELDVYEVELLRKDGSSFWALVHATPVYNARGLVVGTTGAITDISARKAAEDALRQSHRELEISYEALHDSEARFRHLFEQAVDALLIYDDQGQVLDTNGRLCEKLGYSREEILKMSVYDFEMNWASQPLKERWASMQPGDTITVDSFYRRKDGTRFPVEVHAGKAEWKGQRVMLALARDVTERKQAESRLHEALFERQRMMETMPDVLFRLDLEGRLIGWNKKMESLTGWSPAELMNRNTLDFFSPENQIIVAAAIMKAYSEGSVEMEAPMLRKDGEPIPMQWSGAPMLDERGLPIGLTGVGRDITQNKRAEEQIRASLREKEVLLKEIHHRVKNNLQIISSLLNLQLDTVEDPKAREAFDESRHRVRSMALIHEMLYRSRDLARIDFHDYLEGLTGGLMRSYSDKQGSVTLDLQADNVYLDIDTAAPCGLIVNELLTNALKYAFPADSHPRGTICVELRAIGNEQLRLSISDNGVGLPHTLDPELVDSIGLQLVTGLTEQIEGSYQLCRENGTCWTITFPQG